MIKDSHSIQTAKILSFHPTGEYYFSKGLQAYHRRDLYKAKKYFGRAFELEPFEPMIACQLAIVCTDLGEYSDSNVILEDIISQLDPYMTECHYFLANNYAHLGLFKEAYRHANEYINKDKHGEFIEDAEDLIELITLENSETEESLFEQDTLIHEQEKAREYLETGDFEKAIDVLKETIQNNPEFWFAYNNLALAHYYLGQRQEAFHILEEVLEKNPGNLHALCNLVVFYFYEKNAEEVDVVVASLEKIRPILPEQQYKLGATFALVGKFELAYMWLKRLQKSGFEGDDTFYYWLSYSSHHLGYERSAKSAWKKVLTINPDKEGLEPWGMIHANLESFEHQIDIIVKKLESELIEERLLGLFLYKHSFDKKQLAHHSAILNNELFSTIENSYVRLINNGDTIEPIVYFIDEVAELLYKQYHPITLIESGLFIIWFSAYEEARKEGIKFSNPSAWAGAVEYVWSKMTNELLLQKDLAVKYGVSISTLRKYVKIVNSLLY
ncbi:tetratricopeptide repeat protein [Bacillus massiliigorillae]|uniref:tetratricopeptide repeat protein n=1 Tax=Bacillus massiliigorillae TaxID=1243664 RepID=UPI0003A8A8C2|nr:tetratricopeptide repeat protein [Bacillus massiliigorillae]